MCRRVYPGRGFVHCRGCGVVWALYLAMPFFVLIRDAPGRFLNAPVMIWGESVWARRFCPELSVLTLIGHSYAGFS